MDEVYSDPTYLDIDQDYKFMAYSPSYGEKPFQLNFNMENYCLEFLVLGKPGIGKSTLVNGLVGEEIAKVSAKGAIATHGVTRIVESHETIKEDVTIKVWDTPGLLDPEIKPEDILNDVKKICGKVDLIIFCLDMNTTRLYDNGEEAKMANMITDILGREIWKKTLIVLVQANMFICRLKDHYNDDKLRLAFEDNIKSWKHLLAQKIPTKDIKVVPAGYFKHPFLFPGDKKTWLSKFWKEAYKRLPEQKQPLLFCINRSRFSVLPHTKSGKEIDLTRERKDDAYTKSKNQVPSITSAPPISSDSLTRGYSLLMSATRPIPLQNKKTKLIEKSSMIASSCPQPSTMFYSPGRSAYFTEESHALGEFSPADQSEIESEVGDLSDIDPALEKSTLSTRSAPPQQATAAAGKLEVRDQTPLLADTLNSSQNSHNEDSPKAGDTSNDATQDKNLQTAVTIQEKEKKEANLLPLPIHTSNPKKSSTVESTINEGTEEFIKMDASKSPASSEADLKQKEKDIDNITTQKSEESTSMPDKEKKKPPPTKPKPKKLSLGSSPQQETPPRQKKVGKLAPELMNKFNVLLLPGSSSTISTFPRRRSNTTPPKRDAEVGSLSQEKGRRLTIVSENGIFERKLEIKKKHASYHSESNFSLYDVKEPTLKKSDSSMEMATECHPKIKNSVAFSKTSGAEEPSTPTITFNFMSVTIEEIKKQPLSEQPIVVSESFWEKISSTFSKFWKKMF